jgi:hypothetical protein
VSAYAHSRFTAQKQLIAGQRGLLDEDLAQPAARHGGEPRRATEQFGQLLATTAPLVGERRSCQALDVRRMGVRMAADLMPAGGQLAHLLGPQEARRAEHDGRDKKVAAIAPALQRVRDLQRARAAVVEGERHVGVISEHAGTRVARGKRVEVALEVVGR